MMYLMAVGLLNYAMVLGIRRLWNYDSKSPDLQLRRKFEFGIQLTNDPLYMLWLLISRFLLQSFIALVLGIVGQFAVSLLALTRVGMVFQNTPLHVLNYNYSMGQPKSQQHIVQSHIEDINSKIGRRFEYWWGYGRFV